MIVKVLQIRIMLDAKAVFPNPKLNTKLVKPTMCFFNKCYLLMFTIKTLRGNNVTMSRFIYRLRFRQCKSLYTDIIN